MFNKHLSSFLVFFLLVLFSFQSCDKEVARVLEFLSEIKSQNVVVQQQKDLFLSHAFLLFYFQIKLLWLRILLARLCCKWKSCSIKVILLNFFIAAAACCYFSVLINVNNTFFISLTLFLLSAFKSLFLFAAKKLRFASLKYLHKPQAYTILSWLSPTTTTVVAVVDNSMSSKTSLEILRMKKA